MKTILISFTTAITFVAIASSVYLAGLENPTDIQTQLSTTTNAIAVAGTTAVFGLLDHEIDDKDSDH